MSDLRGDITIGSTPTPIFYDDNNVASKPTALFNTNALLAAEANFYVNIDSDNSGTDAKFAILINAQSSSGTEVFKVTEAGVVSASSFTGDGAGLSGITSTQIDLFGGGPEEHELVTVNAAGTGLDAEANLTFNGEVFSYTLAAGDTQGDGIKMLTPANNGKLLLQNDNSTSDQYIPKIAGEASDGMTAAGLPGLIVEGRPSQDNTDNPCIVLRGIDATNDSATEASDILQIR